MCRSLPYNENVTFFNGSCVVGICLFAEPPSCPNASLKICSSCDISVLYVEILLKNISLFNFQQLMIAPVDLVCCVGLLNTCS